MRIRFIHKLLAAFGLSGLVVVLIYVSAVGTAGEAVSLVDRVVNFEMRKLAVVNNIQAQASKIRTLEVEIPKLTDIFAASGAAGELWQEAESFQQTLQGFLAEYYGVNSSASRELAQDWVFYRENLNKTLSLIQESRFDEASDHANYESRPRFHIFALGLQGVSVQAEAEAREAFASSVVRFESRLATFRILSLAGLGFGLLFTLAFSRSLSGRILHLRNGALRLAAGDMDYRIEVRGQDEVGELAGSFNQMGQEIRARQDALHQSELRFRALVETTSDWIWEVDPSGVYTYASPKVKDLLGYDPIEVLGKTLFDLMPPQEARRVAQEFGRIAEARAPFSGLINHNLSRDGREIVIETGGVPIYDSQGQFCGYRGIDRDITERKLAEEALRRAHDELELRVRERTAELTQTNDLLSREVEVRRLAEENMRALNRELDAFVYTLSHDLRNPLGAIIGTVDYLAEEYRERLDQDGREFLTGIAGEGHRMLALMEDLLTLARVGRVNRPDEPVDAKTVALQVLQTLEDRVFHLSATVQVEAMPEIRVPASLLSQVFDNLIGNALRYGCPMEGRIEVGGQGLGEQVRYYVRDHGPGIPPEERERVFEVFYRGASGAGLKGTGVGLATVQKIAQVFGGRAWVEQTPGGGSTFWVEMSRG